MWRGFGFVLGFIFVFGSGVLLMFCFVDMGIIVFEFLSFGLSLNIFFRVIELLVVCNLWEGRVVVIVCIVVFWFNIVDVILDVVDLYKLGYKFRSFIM